MNTANASSNLPSYDEIETPSYAEAPYDETNGKYKKFTEEIGLPDHQIVVIGDEYRTTSHTVFFMRKAFSKYSAHSVVVCNSENKEIASYKKRSADDVFLYDNDNNVILNAKISLSFKKLIKNFFDHFVISSGRGNNGQYGIIDAECIKINMKKYITYTARFKNLVTGKDETIEIRNEASKLNKFKYYVYCNPGQENETMICKIKRNLNKINFEYTIEIAPGVDYMYMIAFCSIFIGIRDVHTFFLFNENV